MPVRRLLLVVALSVGCSGDGSSALAAVRLGLLLPLSGDLEAFGPSSRDAVRQAVGQINAVGGLLGGRRVQLLVRDTASDPATGRARAMELLDDGVVGLIGPMSSRVSSEVIDLSNGLGVPQVSISSSKRLNGYGPDFFFRTFPPDTVQASVLAPYARREVGCEDLALFQADDQYARPLGEDIARIFELLGGTVSLIVTYEPERPSYAEEVAQIQALDPAPDCVVLLGFPVSVGPFLRDWHDEPDAPEVTFLGTDGIRSGSLAVQAGGADRVDGILGSAPVMQPDSPEYDAYARRYRTTFDAEPATFSPHFFDAAVLLMLGIEWAGSTHGAAVRDSLGPVSRPDSSEDPRVHADELVASLDILRAARGDRPGEQLDGAGSIDYVGASGPVDFDELGNVVSDYEIWRLDASAPESDCADHICRITILRARDIELM